MDGWVMKGGVLFAGRAKKKKKKEKKEGEEAAEKE